MTVVLTLYCNGNAETCPSAFTVISGSAREARSAARAGGWKTSGRGRDFCPQCRVEDGRPARATPRVPTGSHMVECHTCARQPRSELRGIVGHDKLGHMVANRLAGHGIRDLATLQRLPVATLRAIPHLGEAGLRRVLSAREANPPRPLPQRQSRPAG